MSYCHFHPLNSASHRCNACQNVFCPTCLDENRHSSNPDCFICGRTTESLGVRADVEPFWRRIDQSFRYPLTAQTMTFIVVISLTMAAASFVFMPLMIGMTLLSTGIMFKYCFNCLSETAKGNLHAPDIADAYNGGVLLVLKILFVIVMLIVITGFVAAKIGLGFASFLGVLIVISLPAMIILYAMTEDLTEALNPLKIVVLISRIGMPYGIILGMIMIMMGSVDILSHTIGYEHSFAMLTLQSLVSNFYSVVIFHLMGYMIFQYQHNLGYSAEEQTDNRSKVRPEKEKLLAKIQLITKTGDLAQSAKLYAGALKRYPDDKELNDAYFRFSLNYVPETFEQATEAFDYYLAHLYRNRQLDKLAVCYKQACIVMNHYIPNDPLLRLQLAKQCYERGNFTRALKLLSGFQKAFPHFLRLVEAYELMLETMQEIPSLSGKIPAFEAQLKKLRDQHQNKQGASRFAAADSKKDASMPNSTISESRYRDETEENSNKDNKKDDLPPMDFC